MARRKSERARERSERKAIRSRRISFADYCSRVARRARQVPKQVRAHALYYVATNALLVLINGILGFSFPWSLFPLAGWGIALIDHVILAQQRAIAARELTRVDDLSPHQTAVLRALHRNRTTFAVSLASSFATALALVAANLIIPSSFPWSAITAGGLGLIVLTHYLIFAARRNRLLGRIGEGIPPGVRQELAGMRLFDFAGWPISHRTKAPEVVAALDLRKRIESRLLELDEIHSSIGAEVMPLLERFVRQIGRLVAQRDDIRALSRRSVEEGLITETARLTAELEAARSDSLRREYEGAIAQVTAHLESVRKLRDRAAIADLRLASALNSLKQLEINMARMRSLSDQEEGAVSTMLRTKINELSEYIEDFEEGIQHTEPR